MQGITLALVIAIGGWVWNTQTKLNRLEWENERDQKQDRQLKKFWKLHHWAKDELNRLGREHDFEIKSWPDIADEGE